MDIPRLTTKNLILRPFSHADVPAMQEIMGGQDVLRYFPSDTPPNLAKVEKMVVRILDHWQTYHYGLWALEAANTGTLVGRCGLQYIPETSEVEIDFILGRDYWGQGFATESGQAALQYGFDILGIGALVGIVHPQNKASQRVLEKLGLHFTEQTEYFGMACYRYEVVKL